MSDHVQVIKRQGRRPTEAFSKSKLKASIASVCLSVHTPEGQAKESADAVCRVVLHWLKDKPEITSGDIRRVAAAALATYHPEASHLYKQHHMII